MNSSLKPITVEMDIQSNTIVHEMNINSNELMYKMGVSSFIRQIVSENYDDLTNLPKLNGVTIQGSKVSDDYFLPKIEFDSTENWNSKATTISEKNTFYIYTDYKKTEDNKNIAGIKIGDGLAYIIDLPFLDAIYCDHVENTDIHITPEERAFWNNKERSFVYGDNLILTKE